MRQGQVGFGGLEHAGLQKIPWASNVQGQEFVVEERMAGYSRSMAEE